MGRRRPALAFEPASAAEIRERLQATEPPMEITLPDEDDTPEPQVSHPVVVESATEPVFSTEGSPASERRSAPPRAVLGRGLSRTTPRRLTRGAG